MKTIYHNASVYTGKLPLQQAFCVEDGRFTMVGSDLQAQKWEADERVDLQGHFVCAGFNDSHMHLLNLGQSLKTAQLHQHTTSLEDMLECLKNTKPGRGGWIIGRGWNQDYFSDVKRMPDRYDLDIVSAENPVCAIRCCGHALSVNSKALQILGITETTKSPEGGEIVMQNGEPNGIFFDNAMDLILNQIPVPDKEELKEMILLAGKLLNQNGITSCQSDDYCVFHNLHWSIVNDTFRELEAEGKLSVRVYEQANFTSVPALQEFIASGNTTGSGTDMFKIGPLKMLGDGALGARTAFLSRPYADAPDTKGLSVFTKEEFDNIIGYANQQGMQIAVHCIGDACLDLVLDSYENSLQNNPREDHRHGIVHCQITRQDQLEKMAHMGLHIYAQSIFLDYDIHMVNQRVGQELAESSYRWKWLSDHGCTVSNGSDCPVEQPDVMAGIQCAVTRRDLNGWGPYLPEEGFSVQEAIDSFTAGASYASFEEHSKGAIHPGMVADFVVLGENPFVISSDQIKNIPILQTVLSGKTVY